MRALWSQDEASFVGERESLEPSWSWPKPQGIFRCFLAVVVGHVCCRICFEWGDGWMPIRNPKGSFVDDVVNVRRLAKEAGRDPPLFLSQ